MITFIPQEEIVMGWDGIEEALEKFWDTQMNFETLPSLKTKLLANQRQLWLWSDEEFGRFLFVTSIRQSATAKIMTITHTAGFNTTGKPFNRRQQMAVVAKVVEEMEDVARTLYCDVLCFHARPGHVKLTEPLGFKPMAVPVVKQLTNNKET